MISPDVRPVRQGQAHKRAAILSAARELFVTQGTERTSMDAVSALAGVSKRTVYDYYGDKRRLLLGVVEDAGESLLATLRAAVGAHLSDEAIADADDLEDALVAFAVEIGEAMVSSSDYAATVTLIAQNEADLPELTGHPLDIAHTETLAERLAHFAERGLLDIDDPQLATDHFNALTTQLAFSRRAHSSEDRTRDVMIAGARVFFRAYRSR